MIGIAVTALSKSSLAAKGLLRHSSVSTTERHYTKDVPENTLQAMKQLEALCSERPTEQNLKPSPAPLDLSSRCKLSADL
jgi:hypothetical protein